MKAIVISVTGDISVLQLKEVATPTPSVNQVLIRVMAAAVNFVDTMIRAGKVPPQMMPALPVIPGVECSGVVEAVGPGVKNLKIGDRVIYMGRGAAGCYAEFVAANVDKVWRLPDSVPYDLAAAMPLNYITAYHMFHNLGQVKAGQTILVHAGAGGVGTALVQLAKIQGAQVIGLTDSPAKMAYVEAQGAQWVIDYRSENVVQQVMAITGGKGVKVSFNCVGGQTLMKDAELLAGLGQVVFYGLLGGVPTGSLTEFFMGNFTKSLAVRASDINTFYLEDPSGFSNTMKNLLSMLREKKIAPQILMRFNLKEAASAHSAIEGGTGKGKIILDVAL